MKSEFDKAEQIYEKIIQNAPDEPEAHWGLILCKFGIEYVEDPATFKRVPTCHRTSFDSIIADDDYKEALRCADSIQREVYEREAKEIDRLQKEILALSAKEEPYDVFICYKESDNGTRTPDSVIANDIYHQLTNEGFKVFYSAITLEDKLGSAYEPCIFAALNSAKVMLAIGTKPEYFNAVWVKNEWSRYLKMMKKDRSKLLIPCYKDMDAYELPEEFAHLQAQDMSKIGFINDIVRGIKKVIVKDEPKAAAPKAQPAAPVPAGNPTANSLVKRAFIFLEDGDWSSADEYCEKALDIDPENAQAYLGKLMAELNVRKREALGNQKEPFYSSDNYQKILRYGSDALQQEVAGYNEKNMQTSIYQKATDKLKSAKTVQQYEEVKQLLIPIRSFKDAETLIAKCDEAISAIEAQNEDAYQKASEMASKGNYLNAAICYSFILPYKDSYDQVVRCWSIYNTTQQTTGIAALSERIKALRSQIDKLSSDKETLRQYNEYQSVLMQRRNMLLTELKGLGTFALSRKMQIQAEISSCDEQLVPLTNYTAYYNGINYDAAIEQCRLELGNAVRNLKTLQANINDLQESIDDTEPLDKDKKDRIEILGFGIRTNRMMLLNKEALSNYSKEVNEYIKSSKVSDVIIPDGTMFIGDGAFESCTSLTSVTIPNSVTSIGKEAFYCCNDLTSVTIPDSVTIIGESAFAFCTSLTSVTIPNSVTSIGKEAFYYCNHLTSVTIPDSVTIIGESAFCNCWMLESLNIPDSVTIIGESAFCSCWMLKSLNIPDSVISIGKCAFSECSNLTSITIPDSVTSIAEYAFRECKSLTIKGKKGSYAETYANEEIIPFSAI